MEEMEYPINSFSWGVLTPTVAVKRMDKSAFIHNGTGIPKDISFFFGLSPEGLAEPRSAVLICDGQKFFAHFQMDSMRTRYRLFWKSDFSEIIRKKFPDFHAAYSDNSSDFQEEPLMRFEKLGEDEYLINLILDSVIRSDSEQETEEDFESRPEGGPKNYYGKRYERDPVNRKKAIAFHGIRCAACGFSFEEAYGPRGIGFIEIHHNKPLSSALTPILVDPKNDLIPLCANCHRITHRYRDNVISLEELRKIIRRGVA